MTRRFLAALATFVCLTGAASCGPRVELAKALAVTDVLTGYYDVGVVDGLNKLVPSITFRLRNTSADPISGVQLTVAYWEVGADGENESLLVRGIGGTALEPGASTEPITVRATKGYTTEGARADIFTHSMYRGFIAKVFAKQGGRIVPLGEFKTDPRLIPAAPPEAGRQ
jgi:hypothetical protein